MAYFNNFPKITYDGVTIRNILLKSALISEVFNNFDNFYPYIVKDGYRPDLVANEFYGDPKYDWVIHFSNRVVDPYYEWPLSTRDFRAFLEKKYNTTIYSLMNTTSHYEYTGVTNESAEDIARKTWKMSSDTHARMAAYGEDTSGWTAVSIYDYEDRLNESRRSIKLLAPAYLNQIEKELAKIFA